MLRSLFSGVSGLRSHQTMMDTVGNNIANVNTTGFKGSSTVFQDLLSQTLAGAGAPGTTAGGTNPAQVGLGVRVASITTNFAQGALQTTGKSSDVAIQGDGFFVVNMGGQQAYTRAGAFDFDANGNLVTPNGGLVQGWMADPVTGVITSTEPTGNLTLPPGQLIAPVKTNSIFLGNMLSASAANGATVSTGITAYDTQGIANDITFTYTKSGTNAWSVDAFDNTGANIGTANLTFNATTGFLQTVTPATFTIQPNPAPNWPAPITIDFGDPTTNPQALKEYGGTTTAAALSQDGSPAGTLQSFRISEDGTVTGVFSNGTSKAVAQLALASFNNPAGLEKTGDSNYRTSANSGVAQIGTPGAGGRGRLASGSLEMSNVDLSREFTSLIIAQRGFQANSKVITSSDDLLQELLNLKR